jgi:hypothetical protein
MYNFKDLCGGFRLAAKYHERIQAIITQNGNAYDEGLLPSWDPIRKYWENPRQENKENIKKPGRKLYKISIRKRNTQS